MNLPAWVLPYKEPKTEIKRINGHFYKYVVEYRYNAAKKRTDKVSGRLLGRLSETDGFIPSARQSTATDQVDLRKVDIKTFGVFGLFRSLLGEEINGILSLFSREVSEILLIVALYRFAHQSAIKRMPHYHSTDYSSEHWSKTGLNAKNITQALRKVGENREIIVNWMQKRIASPSASLSNFLMIDSTHIPTVSENLHINAAGYNPQSSFDKQIRLMYIFSSELKQPVYYRLINGNIADISSMKACVEELNVRPVVFVADKGFYSKNNTNTLRKNKLHFIIPLRRDNNLIDYTLFQSRNFKKGNKNFFTYQNRIIWFHEYQVEGSSIVTYLDEELRVKEEKDYLNRCGTHPEVYTLDKFETKVDTFGTLSIVYELPLKPTPEVLYQTYKQRNEVEVMFDAYKHFLDADKTYMQDRYVFEGWLMANFIAMIAYYRLYAALKGAGKLSTTSPKDIVEFSKSVCKIRSGDTWITTETTAKVKTLLNALKIDYLNEQS
jgi:Transposase DDE domain